MAIAFSWLLSSNGKQSAIRSKGTTMEKLTMTRRDAMFATVGASVSTVLPLTGTAQAAANVGGAHAIPELAPQWKKLDLKEILSRPAAFMSVSQIKSVYEPWGAQAGERHYERGSLPATVKVAKAARAAGNFKSFNWVGYTIFREDYPQSDFDRVQYQTWTEGLKFTPEMKLKDNELATDLQALVQPATMSLTKRLSRQPSPAPPCRSSCLASAFKCWC